MAEKTEKKDTNPFNVFKDAGKRHIEVKALNGAKVEIKNALTVEQEQNIKSTSFARQETRNGRVMPNHADQQMSKTQAVSYLLVEPKMTIHELGQLNGATEAIDEIYEAYMEYKLDKKGN